MSIANPALGEEASGAQVKEAMDNRLDQHSSDNTSTVNGHDFYLTSFPIEHYKKTKIKLGRGAFGTVRV